MSKEKKSKRHTITIETWEGSDMVAITDNNGIPEFVKVEDEWHFGTEGGSGEGFSIVMTKIRKSRIAKMMEEALFDEEDLLQEQLNIPKVDFTGDLQP